MGNVAAIDATTGPSHRPAKGHCAKHRQGVEAYRLIVGSCFSLCHLTASLNVRSREATADYRTAIIGRSPTGRFAAWKPSVRLRAEKLPGRTRPKSVVRETDQLARNAPFVQVREMEQAAKSARKIRLSARGIVVFSSGIIVGLAVALFWTSALPPSSLTKDLPSGWTEASSKFDARIRTRFPVGSSAQKLIDGLGEEGFKPTWFETEGEYGAKRDEGSFVCNVAARVFWRVGQNSMVSAIRGTYREEGCL